ncbi:MAG: RidA family protein [Desulfobacterales bacterium]|nr:RidA family protein [Desulfobacterales bacterium]
MANKTIQTDQAPSAIGPYSQGVAAGPLVFVSGQLGMHPESGELVSSEFNPQAGQALENMKNVLRAGGCELTDVAAVDVFVTDMANFAAFNDIYAGYFSDFKPARAVVEVSALPKGGLVEIKCMAHRGAG